MLGFETFARSRVQDDIETAFHGAKSVLCFLAQQSPQAAHYLEILTSLSSSVEKRRAAEASVTRKRYVSRIFSLDSAPNDDSQLHGGELEQAPWLQISTPSASNDPLEIFPDTWSFDQIDTGDLCLDGESLSVSLWDNFPFIS